MGDVCTLLHRQLGRCGELAAERAYDQESHGFSSVSFEKNSGSAFASVVIRLDDFRHGHPELVLDENDFPARDQPIVDVDVDGLTDLAIQFKHSTRDELDKAADLHVGAAEPPR